MDLPELLDAVGVVQFFAAELLAGQVEDAVADNVEAVEGAVPVWDAEDLAAVALLHQKGRDGALAQGAVLRRPVRAHPGGAGLRAPDPGEQVVVIPGRQAAVVGDIGGFPAIEFVFPHDLTSLLELKALILFIDRRFFDVFFKLFVLNHQIVIWI